jgi:peptidoglycan/LPS O-acetylase OafA/YrhL
MRSTQSDTVPFPETQASVLLDLVRGTAAIMVLIEHIRNLMFVPWKDVTGQRALWFPFYLVTGAGHQAVVLFFLLSGYLVSSTVLRARAQGRWSWKSYSEHRLVRLWIVLWPALLLGLLLDSIGSRLPHAEWLYVGRHGSGMLQNAAQHLGLSTLAGNAVFLQTIFVDTLGTNGALWSLSNEFWYYVIFPLGLIALRGPARVATRIVFAILAVAIAVMVGREILLAFPIWLLGAALNLVKPGTFHRWVLLPVVPVFLALFFAHTYYGLERDYALAIVGFVLLATLLGFRQRAQAGASTKISRNLARFSYTLYLVHTPFLVLIAGLLIQQPWQPGAGHFVTAVAVLLATLLYAWIIASFTEFHTDAVRRTVSRWFARRGPPLWNRKLKTEQI